MRSAPKFKASRTLKTAPRKERTIFDALPIAARISHTAAMPSPKCTKQLPKLTEPKPEISGVRATAANPAAFQRKAEHALTLLILNFLDQLILPRSNIFIFTRSTSELSIKLSFSLLHSKHLLIAATASSKPSQCARPSKSANRVFQVAANPHHPN